MMALQIMMLKMIVILNRARKRKLSDEKATNGVKELTQAQKVTTHNDVHDHFTHALSRILSKYYKSKKQSI